MADTPNQSSALPTTCPIPNYALIRQGDKAGLIELAQALQNIVNTLNSYIVRHGG